MCACEIILRIYIFDDILYDWLDKTISHKLCVIYIEKDLKVFTLPKLIFEMYKEPRYIYVFTSMVIDCAVRW